MDELTTKQKYRNFSRQEKTIPIFSKDWWLDATCGEENWDVSIVEKNNEIIASLPYYKKKFYGLSSLVMPKLTQKLGIWMKYPANEQKENTKIGYEIKTVSDIIDQLPEHTIFKQRFDYSFQNWLPFYWKGFHQSTRYTYVLDNLNDLDTIYNNFSSNCKKMIRKAKKNVHCVHEPNIDKFYRINALSFTRQGLKIPYSLDLLKRINHACEKNACRMIFFAVDDKNKIHSSIYLIWDEESAYYLAGGGDKSLRQSGANNLLFQEAIKFAANRTKRFDFEGSMIKGVEHFFREFGAKQFPYFSIFKYNILGLSKFLRKIS